MIGHEGMTRAELAALVNLAALVAGAICLSLAFNTATGLGIAFMAWWLKTPENH